MTTGVLLLITGGLVALLLLLVGTVCVVALIAARSTRYRNPRSSEVLGKLLDFLAAVVDKVAEVIIKITRGGP